MSSHDRTGPRIIDHVILMGIGLAAIFWLSEAILHAFVSGSGGVARQLLHPEPHEMWMRLLAVGLFAAFSASIHFSLKSQRRTEEALSASNECIKTATDSLDALVYVADMATHEILYVNEYGRATWGDVLGKTCWQALQGEQSGPCHFCTNERLLDSNGRPTGLHVWEFENTVSHRWYECRDRAIRWEDGRFVRMAIATDITKRKEAEQAARLAQFSVDNASDAVLWVTSDARLIYANEAASRLLGHTREELLSMRVPDIIADLTAETWPDRRQEIKERGSLRAEFLGRRKGGGLFPAEVTINSIEFGGKEYNFVSVRDIAERKQARRELAESEDKYRMLFRDSPEAISVTHCGRMMHVNPAWLRLHGYESEDEVLGSDVLDIIHPNDRDILVRRREMSDQQRIPGYELRDLRKDGSSVFVEVYSTAISLEGDEVILTAIRDITARKQAEEALRKSEEKYRELVENANSIILRMDPKGKVTFFNEFAQKFFGYTEEEMLGRNVVGTIVPERESSGRDLRAMIEEIGRCPELYATNENENMRRDGERVWSAWTNKGVADRQGRVVEVLCIGNDITDRKQVEEELRKERDRAQTYLDVAGVIFVAIDANEEVILINRKGCEILECESDEILGRNWFDSFVPSGMRDEIRSVYQALMRGEMEPVEHYENTVLTKGKAEKIIAWHNTVLRDASGKILGTLGSGEDITDRKRAEAEREEMESRLRQAQKMEAIGTLAGGIAHDFNNILSAIFGYSEMALREDLGEDSPVRQRLERVLEAAYRARDLVRQILTISRRQEEERSRVRIGPVVKEVLKLLTASFPSTIEIRDNITAVSDVVYCDSTQIHQLLLNLCTNAAQAMREHGGVLHVGLTDAAVDPETTPLQQDIAAGPYVRLTVSDTGTGMGEDVMARIFEPYFTTKRPGHGTGLGLAVAHGIVRSHKGDIAVQSEPGKGTTFTVLLPTAQPDVSVAPQAATAAPPRGDKERILFVDDEETLVDMARDMLQDLGYEVTAQKGSLGAIDAFRKRPDEFDLVITDQTMPKMTGAELAEELLRIRADIPVILCTGFSDQITAEQAAALGIREFLMKPLSRAEIARAIRRALRQTGTLRNGET